MLPPDDAVSLWLDRIKVGDRDRVTQLFDHYFQRLVGLAAARLRGRAEFAGFEEDVALSAFKSLCLGAERGRFPELTNRDELWRLFAVITVRKAIELQRKKQLVQPGQAEDLEEVFCREPSPEAVAEASENVNALLDKLGDPELRQIALWKVEGQTNEEISRQLNCVERTIERKLHQIRMIWRQEAIS